MINGKKMTQTKFIQLMNIVTGHSKNFIKENTEIQGMDMYVFRPGELSFHSWTKEKYVYTQVFLNNGCIASFYHDFETLIQDYVRSEKDHQEDLEDWLEMNRN